MAVIVEVMHARADGFPIGSSLSSVAGDQPESSARA